MLSPRYPQPDISPLVIHFFGLFSHQICIQPSLNVRYCAGSLFNICVCVCVCVCVFFFHFYWKTDSLEEEEEEKGEKQREWGRRIQECQEKREENLLFAELLLCCRHLTQEPPCYSSSPPQGNFVFSGLSLEEKKKPRAGESLA